MSRRLPSLNALRAFEAAARHLSLTKAAGELSVTPGALSHQIKALEARLGAKLFQRTARGLAFTDLGRDYLPVVRDAFDRLAAGTETLFGAAQAATLTVSVSPNFAQKWLVPRLGRFAAAHPAVELRIAASTEHVDFAASDVDLAVRHGDGNWPGLAVAKLADEHVIPVASPRLAGGKPPLKRPRDLKSHTLLHAPGPVDWRSWAAAAGLPDLDVRRGPRLDQASLAIEAAVDGVGVALARTALAALDLAAGRLVQPFGPALAAPFAYYIVCPAPVANRPKIRTFREWALAEAADDAKKLAKLGIGK
ncbi:MAG: transcriptional regulator GcvA [Candidatus Odyssella sp.]|nr:transcriptional regulator GcvA [Candidatus Odyssella sp.]